MTRSAQQHVQAKLEKLGLEVGFGGRLISGATPSTVAASLRQRRHSWRSIEDELILDTRVQADKISGRVLKAAINRVRDVEERRHFSRVMKPLVKEISAKQREAADHMWSNLATNSFETSADVVMQGLKQFIWLVKRRACGLKTTRQIMPLVLGATQGAGKSEFIKKFLDPLGDLVAYSSLAEAIDDRQGDLLGFPALVVDDVDPLINKQALAKFKFLVTGHETNRRILGSSRSAAFRIACSLIGSANDDVSTLFADSSGYRRLVPMYFRNGQVDRGGDPKVWATINVTNMKLLWRSVDMHGPAPIDQIWAQLAVNQGGTGTEGEILAWIRKLDVDAEAVRVRISGSVISVADLLDLFEAQAGREISPVTFGRILKRLTILHNDLPIGTLTHGRKGNGYSVRPKPATT